jgi:hypothetical protein
VRGQPPRLSTVTGFSHTTRSVSAKSVRFDVHRGTLTEIVTHIFAAGRHRATPGRQIPRASGLPTFWNAAAGGRDKRECDATSWRLRRLAGRQMRTPAGCGARSDKRPRLRGHQWSSLAHQTLPRGTARTPHPPSGVGAECPHLDIAIASRAQTSCSNAQLSGLNSVDERNRSTACLSAVLKELHHLSSIEGFLTEACGRRRCERTSE